MELVSSSAHAYDFMGVSVTQYLPSHLKAMSAAGSLFVLHLRLEGQVLQDQSGILARTLGAYAAPRSYMPLRDELQTAARATDLRPTEVDKYRTPAFRLSLFLLRTLAYIECIELGSASFDLEEAANRLRKPHLRWMASKKRATRVTARDLNLARVHLKREFGEDCINPGASLEAYAVEVGDRPYAAALVGSMLSFNRSPGLPYESLALPPL